METVLERRDKDSAALIIRYTGLFDHNDGRKQSLNGITKIPWDRREQKQSVQAKAKGKEQKKAAATSCGLPALAPDTALEMALLEIARFRFMISSNSASLTGGGKGPNSRLRDTHTSSLLRGRKEITPGSTLTKLPVCMCSN